MTQPQCTLCHSTGSYLTTTTKLCNATKSKTLHHSSRSVAGTLLSRGTKSQRQSALIPTTDNNIINKENVTRADGAIGIGARRSTETAHLRIAQAKEQAEVVPIMPDIWDLLRRNETTRIATKVAVQAHHRREWLTGKPRSLRSHGGHQQCEALAPQDVYHEDHKPLAKFVGPQPEDTSAPPQQNQGRRCQQPKKSSEAVNLQQRHTSAFVNH